MAQYKSATVEEALKVILASESGNPFRGMFCIAPKELKVALKAELGAICDAADLETAKRLLFEAIERSLLFGHGNFEEMESRGRISRSGLGQFTHRCLRIPKG